MRGSRAQWKTKAIAYMAVAQALLVVKAIVESNEAFQQEQILPINFLPVALLIYVSANLFQTLLAKDEKKSDLWLVHFLVISLMSESILMTVGLFLGLSSEFGLSFIWSCLSDPDARGVYIELAFPLVWGIALLLCYWKLRGLARIRREAPEEPEPSAQNAAVSKDS